MSEVHETLPHGSTVLSEGGRVTAVKTRDGVELVALQWASEGLERATLTLPDQSTLALVTDGSTHPIFGTVDRLCDDAGQTVAFFGRVDWEQPAAVPPLDRPGALPSGAGAAVLNLLALSARHADIPRLRYRGPYPTAALFDALLASFDVDGDVGEALQSFCADVERVAIAGQMVTAPVDFSPAPFEWSWPAEGVCVQRRDGIERLYVRGASYERRRVGSRRVVSEPDGGCSAVVMVGATRWATVLTLDASGAVTGPPQPLPEAPADLVGTPLPPAVTEVLADAVAGRAPGPLAAAVRGVLTAGSLRWGDPDPQIVRRTDAGIELHAGLVAALPTESAPLLDALLTLVEPITLRLAQARLAEAHEALARR